MRILLMGCFQISLLLAVGTCVAKSPHLMLTGGGLKLCSSLDPTECEKPLRIRDEDLGETRYAITTKSINGIEGANWLPERQSIKAEVVRALKLAAATTTGELSKRQWLNAFRKAQWQSNGNKRTGAAIYRKLHIKERQLVEDWLELPAMDSGFLRLDRRKKVRVQVDNSKDLFSRRLLSQFVSLTKEKGKKGKPKLAFVTAGNSDSFSTVDYYQQVFEQLGAEAVWLPIDAALRYAIRENEGTKAQPYCRDLEVYRQQELGRFQRHKIYPDLHEYQLKLCEDPQKLLDLISSVQGLYFVDGEPLLLHKALVHKDGSATSLLLRIKQAMTQGQLIVAADGGAARAMNAAGPVILSGDSHQALVHGGNEFKEGIFTCREQNNCPANLVSNGLIYHNAGGISLLEGVSIDSRFSERARQGRLARLLTDTSQRLGLGLDERSGVLVSSEGRDLQALTLKALGENSVSVFDAQEILADPGIQRGFRSMRFHLLTQDDTLFFRGNKLVVSFADWKYSSNKLTQPVIQSGNAFRSDNFRRIAKMLCQTGAQNATLKHTVVGTGHSIFVQKSRSSVSLSGRLNINGKNFAYCSFRDYYIDVQAL